MNLLETIGLFLILIIFPLYIGVIMVRVLLALVRADFYNPLSQAIVSITNPLLVPLRRVIPPIRQIDLAAILLMLALQLLELWLRRMLGDPTVGYLNIFIQAPYHLIKLLIYIYMFALIVQAVISWVAPGLHNPMASLLNSLTTPLLRPLRRVIPPAGMIDLSPMVAIILLGVAKIVIDYIFMHGRALGI